jgi:hypothetical protein
MSAIDNRSEVFPLPASLRSGAGIQVPTSVNGEPATRAHGGSGGSAQRGRVLYFLNTFDRGGAELGLLFLARNGFFTRFKAREEAICQGQERLEHDLAASDLRAEALFPTGRMSRRHIAAGLPRFIGLLRREQPAILVHSRPQANIIGRIAACLTGILVVVSFEHNTRLSRRPFELLSTFCCRRGSG